MSGLITHVARFGRALRERGVPVTLSDEADALEALALVDVGDRAEVARALRSALKIRPRDRALFDELFAAWWIAAARPAPAPDAPRERRRTPALPRGELRPLAAGAGGLDRESRLPAAEGGREPSYSSHATLRKKAFDECSPAEAEAMERLAARLALRLATRPSRRRVPTRGRGEADLRRSFRAALATGGEFLSLARRRRAIEAPRLVVLCDTSGSMDPHLRFLIAFLLALCRVARRTEVFAFNTALVRLTPWLRPGPRSGRAVQRLLAAVPDWSGGTRIAECLVEFVDRYLDELVDARTVVVVASDGLDRGDLAALPDAMRAIRRRARRVLWLNPLAGDPRYQPTARAMAAALPYVDQLLPAHDLESLERLLPLLAA